jgi:uncharacterized protein (TIGR02145 family)
VSGGKFKETGYVHWLEPNTGATNESGLTALPSGYRVNGGEYLYIGDVVYLWSSTEFGSSNAWFRNMACQNSDVYRGYFYERNGFSVRCLTVITF